MKKLKLLAAGLVAASLAVSGMSFAAAPGFYWNLVGPNMIDYYTNKQPGYTCDKPLMFQLSAQGKVNVNGCCPPATSFTLDYNPKTCGLATGQTVSFYTNGNSTGTMVPQ